MGNLIYLKCFCLLVIMNAMVFGAGKTADVSEALSVSTVAYPLKTENEYGKDVPFLFVIANHGQKPVYLSVDTAEQIDTVDLFPAIFDESGQQIMSDPIPEPPIPPPSHYMSIDGRRIFVTPYILIPAKSIKILKVPDATKYYKNNIRDGKFTLKFRSGVNYVYKAKSIITRKEYPGVVWIEPTSILERIKSEINPVKITIRKLTQE